MSFKNLLYIVTFLLTISSTAQNKYPQNYFRSPLDVPLILSGTFGELRSNHFHSGIDLKTQQREGLKTYAIANGYVSRIKYKRWGYGKAIYIKHPNGYTSVYAHLQKAEGPIESFIKKKQYANKKFDMDIRLQPHELPVKKGQIIGYTGTTGNVAPHLHFEIRTTANAKPVNPMHFGIRVEDTKKPSINVLMGYPLSDFALVNGSSDPIKIDFTRQKDGSLLANQITAEGDISFGINAFDRQNGGMNKNGLYSLEMLVNGQRYYKHEVETFSFAESKLINLLIDYERYKTHKQRVQKCFVEPRNTLSIYNGNINNGHINIQDGMQYNVEIIAKDFDGNTSRLKIPVLGVSQETIYSSEDDATEYSIKANEFNKFTKNGVTVAFPKKTFYEDMYINFNVQDSLVSVHNETVPLHKSYTLTFDVSKYTPEQRKHMFIAKKNSRGKYNYVSTKKKDNKFYTKTKYLGDYTLRTDTKKPTIRSKNFKTDQWLSKYRYLKLSINDDFSGIDSYTATIDGKWALFEYDVRRKQLVYDFTDMPLTGTHHKLKIVVKDNAGNTKVYTNSFYRK